MIADEQVTTEPSSLFSAQDQAAIRAQLKKRLILVLIPVLVLLGAAIYFAIQRNEVATDVLTIVSLSALIFCYDLFLKPLRCYQRHLDNVISGRRRAVDLPFLAISDDISLVDGVPYRAMTCTDLDAKGRRMTACSTSTRRSPSPPSRRAKPCASCTTSWTCRTWCGCNSGGFCPMKKLLCLLLTLR